MGCMFSPLDSLSFYSRLSRTDPRNNTVTMVDDDAFIDVLNPSIGGTEGDAPWTLDLDRGIGFQGSV